MSQVSERFLAATTLAGGAAIGVRDCRRDTSIGRPSPRATVPVATNS